MRSESSDWNNSQTSQSPRHKPRPLMEEMRPAPTNQRPARGGCGSDWSDQVEDAVTSDWAKAANNSVPSVPTALVSPRRIEEMDSGRQTVTRSSDLAHTQTRPNQQPARQENSYPYGVEPPPFKENLRPSHSNHQASEIGFSMNSSHYSKPFPAQEPDKVNKAMMYSGREAQNYTSSSGTQMAGHQSHQRAISSQGQCKDSRFAEENDIMPARNLTRLAKSFSSQALIGDENPFPVNLTGNDHPSTRNTHSRCQPLTVFDDRSRIVSGGKSQTSSRRPSSLKSPVLKARVASRPAKKW